MSLQALNLIGKRYSLSSTLRVVHTFSYQMGTPIMDRNVEDPTNITHDSSGIVYVQYHINWQIEE